MWKKLTARIGMAVVLLPVLAAVGCTNSEVLQTGNNNLVVVLSVKTAPELDIPQDFIFPGLPPTPLTTSYPWGRVLVKAALIAPEDPVFLDLLGGLPIGIEGLTPVAHRFDTLGTRTEFGTTLLPSTTYNITLEIQSIELNVLDEAPTFSFCDAFATWDLLSVVHVVSPNSPTLISGTFEVPETGPAEVRVAIDGADLSNWFWENFCTAGAAPTAGSELEPFFEIL